MTRFQLAILAYNEAKNFPTAVKDLALAFRSLPNVELRLVIVDNGSSDNTGETISQMKKEYPFVIDSVRIPVNQGYGYGIKQGMSALTGDIIGYMWGDNQFDAGITAKLVEQILDNGKVMMAKTNRVKRRDGWTRLYVSRFYQFIFRLLYGRFTKDINSGPKIFRADFFKSLLPLQSDDWFIDAEIMIKASRQLPQEAVVELPIEFNKRKFGKSNVRPSDCFRFLFNLIRYKF